MLNIFRLNTAFSIAILILFTILIRASAFFLVVPIQPNLSTPFSSIIFDWLNENQLFTSQNIVLGILLLLFQAFLINYITTTHNILYKNSVLPGLFFVIINSIYPAQLTLTPQILSNTFIILLLNRLCYLYESNKPLYLVLDAGLLLGLAILLDYDTIIYLPFIAISIIYMTSFNLRYLVIAVFGILIPSYFIGVLFFLNNHLADFIYSFKYSLNKNYFNPIGINIRDSFIWFFLIPILLISLIQLQANFFRNRVKTRRIQLIILVMFGFGFISVLAENQGFIFGLPFFAISISILLANFFIRTKRSILKEFLFGGILFCLIFYQYFNR